MILSLLFSLALSPAHAANCKSLVQGVTIYQDLIKGQVVDQFSRFSLESWSEHSAFDLVVVKETVTQDSTLEFSYRASRKAPVSDKVTATLKPWGLEKGYWLSTLKPKEFFQDKNKGLYTVRLLSGSKVLCEDSFPIDPAD